MPIAYNPAAYSQRRIVTDPARRFPNPTGLRVLGGTERDCAEWLRAVASLVRHLDPALRLTGHQHDVAVTTLELVAMGYEQPSRADIARAVMNKGRTCSVRTVERAHRRLAELGYLRWRAEYAIGSCRRDGRGSASSQARRAENKYQFTLPTKPLPRMIPPRVPAGRRHSCDRMKPSLPYDRQPGRVIPAPQYYPLLLPLVVIDADEQATRKAARIAANLRTQRQGYDKVR